MRCAMYKTKNATYSYLHFAPCTLDLTVAPLAEQFSKQLFADLKKLYVTRLFINLGRPNSSHDEYLSSPK